MMIGCGEGAEPRTGKESDRNGPNYSAQGTLPGDGMAQVLTRHIPIDVSAIAFPVSDVSQDFCQTPI